MEKENTKSGKPVLGLTKKHEPSNLTYPPFFPVEKGGTTKAGAKGSACV